MKSFFRKLSVLQVGVALLSSGGIAIAACGDRASGDSDVFKVTVLMLEVSEDGNEFFTVFNGSQVIDIASVNAGAVAAGLVAGQAVPPGEYTRIRVTTGATVQLQGYVNNGGTTVYTDGGTDAAGFTIVGGNDMPGGDCAESTFSVPANVRTSTDIVPTFTVGGPSPSTVRVAFDTTGTIVADGMAATVNDPVVTVTVQ